MPVIRYIDVHTHHSANREGLLSIRSWHEQFDEAQGYCSMGLHPWYLQDLPGQMAALEQYAVQPHVLAIGECGLDKVCATPWPLQEEAFRLQIALAMRLGKPLIIHCVRAYTEVIAMLRGIKIPVVIHGFRKRPELAANLLQQGYYLSFGNALTGSESTAAASLAAMPPDRFFLETDDAALPVENIYEAAARIRKTDPDTLILQLQKNFKTVFTI